MSAWRREAIQRVPMLRQDIEQADDFYELCRLLAERVWDVYRRANILGDTISHSPEDETLLQGIHDYTGYCLLHPHDSDAYTNIVLYFYESLSQGVNVYIVREFYKYVDPEVLGVMESSGILSFILERDNPADFAAEYAAKRRSVSKRVR